MYYDVIVVGAGPAGVIAAIESARNKKKVCIIEQNDEIGKKLRITGGGRCNITSKISIKNFDEKIPRNAKFIKSCFSQFTNDDLIDFLKSINEEIHFEGDKVYLKSNDSRTLIQSLKKLLEELNIKIFLNENVLEIYGDETITGVKTTNMFFEGKYFVLAVGGKSYPQLGSNGVLIEYIKNNNILPITNLFPTLVSINTRNSIFDDLAGVTINSIDIKIVEKNKIKNTIKGDILFTHKGFTGPGILNASSYLIDNNERSTLLDFLPDFGKDELINILMRLRDRNAIIDLLAQKLPKRFLKNIIVDIDYKNASKKTFSLIATQIKDYFVEIESFESYNKAMVTRGGVCCSSINPKTMQSKKHNNLWIVGEMLDVDGLTGGYNLQIAFSSGYVAGKNIGGL